MATVPPMAPTITNATAAPIKRRRVHRFAMLPPVIAPPDGTAAARIRPVPGYPAPARSRMFPVWMRGDRGSDSRRCVV